MNFDYIVVGGGTAGCVVAARLSERREARVLVVEAGPSARHPLIPVPGASAYVAAAPTLNWHRMTQPQRALYGRSLYLAQGRVIGGSSSINGMVYTRGAACDYAHWEQAGAAGWGYRDVLPYFVKAETYSRGANAWHGASGPLQVKHGSARFGIVDVFLDAVRDAGLPLCDDHNAPEGEGIGLYDWMVGKGRRSSAASAYLRPARRRPNLTVHTGAHATRLRVERSRAVGIEYLHNGTVQSATADAEVVLCGGAINSPQLLMLSGIGPADQLKAIGIDPIIDLPMVGANLSNHLSYKISYRCSAPISAYRLLQPAHGSVELLKYAFARGGFLGDGSAPAGGFYRSSDTVDHADMQIFMVPLILGGLGNGLRALLPTEHGLSFFVNQGRPWSTGSVRLASSDPLMAPLIDPRYLSDPRDLAVLIDGVQRLAALADTHAFKAIGAQQVGDGARGDRAALAEAIRAEAGNHYHVSGTCRIGADAGQSVVDSQLRVHGVSGLRIADASVMPRPINANMAAPVMMIAERAAEFIAGRVVSAPGRLASPARTL